MGDQDDSKVNGRTCLFKIKIVWDFKMLIQCPYCQAKYTFNAAKASAPELLVRCRRCNNRFQIVLAGDRQNVAIETQDSARSFDYKENPCPFCGNSVQATAIRCKHCGKFKKKAKLIVQSIRDEHAKQALIAAFNNVCPGITLDLNHLFNDLPKKLQLDYASALELEIRLRKKGITTTIEDGDDILSSGVDVENSVNDETAFTETVYPQITFEKVLKDIYLKSSNKKEFITTCLRQRKDLLAIILIAFIPFLSLDLDDGYQLLFFPVFLGILWVFVVFSFFGDGNVPIKKVVFYFLFSGTVGTFLSVMGNAFIGPILDFLPKLLFFIIAVGCVEESVKILPILHLLAKPKSDHLTIRHIDILVLSITCGIGFSATENIFYKSKIDNLIGLASMMNRDNLASISNFHFLRTISLPLLHGSWTAILGSAVFYGFTIGKKKVYFYWGLAIVALLHGIYDSYNTTIVTVMIVFLSFASLLLIYSFSIYIDKMKQREILSKTGSFVRENEI